MSNKRRQLTFTRKWHSMNAVLHRVLTVHSQQSQLARRLQNQHLRNQRPVSFAMGFNGRLDLLGYPLGIMDTLWNVGSSSVQHQPYFSHPCRAQGDT